MATRGVFDELARSFGNAVTDVREKLIEEAWFGRTTASQERMSQNVGDVLGRQPASPTAAHAPEAPVSFDRMLGQFVQPRNEEPAPYFDRESRQFSGAAEPRAQPTSWDEMTAQMAKARGYEPERDIERDIER